MFCNKELQQHIDSIEVYINELLNTPDIDEIEYSQLVNKNPRTSDETLKICRHCLRRVYQWKDMIDRNFILNYGNIRHIRWYRNLNEAKNKSLEEIQLTNPNNYEKHKLAQTALNIIGFNGINDKRVIIRGMTLTHIDFYKESSVFNYDHVIHVLRIKHCKPPTFESFYSVFTYLNSILYSVYGIAVGIMKKKQSGDKFVRIYHQHNFDNESFQLIDNLTTEIM
jgi:hypothetical protein